MQQTELEECAGIKESDKIDCPYQDDFGTCDACKINLTPKACEELYEQYLIDKCAGNRVKGATK